MSTIINNIPRGGNPIKKAKESGKLYYGDEQPTEEIRLNYDGHFYATKVFGAVYNDYAETRKCKNSISSGYVVCDDSENCDYVIKNTTRCNPACYLTSDTYGFSIGEQPTYDYDVVYIGLCGRVLSYVSEDISELKVGDPLCSDINGKLSKMTELELKEKPYCILGFVSAIPKEDSWGSSNVSTNGRVWVKIK